MARENKRPSFNFGYTVTLLLLLLLAAGAVLLRTGCINFDPGIMAIVGMGAFFAASVRAPVTGIILVCEMTNNFDSPDKDIIVV